MIDTALLIIDIQNDYFPGGAMPLAEPLKAAKQAGKLLQYFRGKNMPVIHVQHLTPAENDLPQPFMVEGTSGQNINSAVTPIEGETIITKFFPSAFTQTNLLNVLQGLEVKQLVVVGMMTHICVNSTVRAARELGFSLRVASDATATLDLMLGDKVLPSEDVQEVMLASLNGFFAEIVEVSDIIEESVVA